MKIVNKNRLQWSQVLNLADKNFKAVIINMFKGLQKVCERIAKYQKRKKSIEKRKNSKTKN